MLKFSEETISLGTVISYSAVTFYYHLENKALIYDRHRWNLSLSWKVPATVTSLSKVTLSVAATIQFPLSLNAISSSSGLALIEAPETTSVLELAVSLLLELLSVFIR